MFALLCWFSLMIISFVFLHKLDKYILIFHQIIFKLNESLNIVLSGAPGAFSEGLRCDSEPLKALHNCSTSAANGSLQQLHSVDNHQVCKSCSALLPLPLSLHHGW